MRSIIEELWYGNVVPMERITPETAEQKKLIDLVERNREKLIDSLTEDQKIIFEKYEDVVWELCSFYERQAFEYGFKLAARIVVESVVYPPIIE